MNKPTTPFNISFLILDEKVKKNVRPVTSLDIYDGATNNFHPDGLYSTQTFGVVGTPQRMERFSWIDTKLKILHPTVFFALCSVKAFYSEIISGKGYARFDEGVHDFVKTEPDEGDTGYAFFLKHWGKIRFVEGPSAKRQENIQLIERKKDIALLDTVYVLPAGYRDIMIDENGRESSDEINKLYYKLIAISNTINLAAAAGSEEMFNQQRMSMQNAVCEIYTTVLSIIKGKNNLFMGKFMGRNVFGSTRNVLTAMPLTTRHLEQGGAPDINTTSVGIYQYINATQHESIYQLRTGFLSQVFIAPGAPAILTNKKTLRSERVSISPKTFDRWMTVAGLKKVLSMFEEQSVRWRPIDIEGYYVGLIYRGPDGTYKFINGIEELPENRKKEDCLPITLVELFYASIVMKSREYFAHVTRYPIGSNRSTYPSKIKLIPTVKKEARVELGDDWVSKNADQILYEFPVRDSSTFNTMAPHPCRHAKLGADHDGDTGSFIVTTSRESIQECNTIMRKREFYLDVGGGFVANLSNDTVGYVNRALTGG